MIAICNGIASYGAHIPFGATFLNFISYGVGAVRLAALSHFRVLYIMTHDSIGLGEDGPTHQPIETLAHLRAIPNLSNWRPADGNEVSGAYRAMFENKDGPSVICLSRQNVPHLEGSCMEKTLKGGYILREEKDKVQVVLVSTGTEVSICVDAAKLLEQEGVAVRVVSLPCWEVFELQTDEYRQQVLPKGVPTLSVEALSTFGWERYANKSVGMTTFGSSAPYQTLYTKFGFDPANVAQKARELLNL